MKKHLTLLLISIASIPTLQALPMTGDIPNCSTLCQLNSECHFHYQIGVNTRPTACISNLHKKTTYYCRFIHNYTTQPKLTMWTRLYSDTSEVYANVDLNHPWVNNPSGQKDPGVDNMPRFSIKSDSPGKYFTLKVESGRASKHIFYPNDYIKCT